MSRLTTFFSSEMKEVELRPEDEFIILACDGLWDVFSNKDAVDFVKVSMDAHNDPQKAASDLVNEAINLGSMDNVTVLLVFFKNEKSVFNKEE
jgi:protein phosphatase 2C family protein 2/3